ncbi:bifunctional 2-C-methyl-D-erythritol 4-phosphate cytidylyltransferase/2-C-methyl-D-erythritol 2,4-cyclodiphosphate synthase [Marinicauda salina]|uniref:Bifunctional enzyme IspD/IspF n=1 Tax=Marinicauda salina TaxID=2135793 RepID=A0A2U2BT47_9PROT|nr:bifunctional 2-C-methyl-D-erythritol 4-phosphate cytidylyltransferase/2-C-methyl-D-erythritol 2,4-cyclodiphosphate synthase [Marinicauda salina]PWE17199.1 bifunctional 2-C-methyl-D-erythritol 4-phosphate cytidylyltransferase/2-C-methyl-D-erythritol 2,4-cyclodiphosphate synthase [Marinicauda salina]
MGFSACIVAAGRGERAGGGTPKQYRALGAKPLLAWSLEAFAAHPGCAEVVVAVAPGDAERVAGIAAGLERPVRTVEGGATRTASVAACVDTATADAVLIHDAARPFLSARLIDRLLAALETAPGAAPALPVADALARRDDQGVEPVSREGLVRIQTPQAFRTEAIRAAFAAAGPDAAFPDEVSLARAHGLDVTLVDGEEDNFKITWPEDFMRAEKLLPQGAGGTPVTGFGYDVHRLAAGDGVTLCGVRIDCPFRLVGHSDADAGLHAVTDAVLGAAGRGDIGEHFPPSDARWKDAPSDRFLRHALDLAAEAGVSIVHADVTLICERPKIGPHRTAMRARLAELLGLPEARVNVKATTTEGLGFTGRGEGLAAQAVVTGIAR